MIKFYTLKQSQSPPKQKQIKPKKLQQEQFLYRYRKIKHQPKFSSNQQESHTLNTLVPHHSPELFHKNQSVSIERCSINDRVIINYLKPLHLKQKQFEYNLIKGVRPALYSQQSKAAIAYRQRQYSYSNDSKSIDAKPLNSKRADSLSIQIFQPSRWTHTTFVSEF